MWEKNYGSVFFKERSVSFPRSSSLPLSSRMRTRLGEQLPTPTLSSTWWLSDWTFLSCNLNHFCLVGANLGNSELFLWGCEHHWAPADSQGVQGDGRAETGAHVPCQREGGARGGLPQGGQQVPVHQVPGWAGSQVWVPRGDNLQVLLSSLSPKVVHSTWST